MSFEDRYGRLDRLLHDIAFRSGQAQRALADVEDLLHADQLEEIRCAGPVFVTALPRSGTTILLELLHQTGRFASQTYRDMPFVLCPILWHRFSRRFSGEDEPVERAHGDGLHVSADSPEAFEEMIWKEFWPEHYRDDRIQPWVPGQENAEFEAFLESHMRKTIWLRREDPSDERRYVSKNNLNIARLASLPRPLRRGIVLVPFRDPVQQAASMLRQHRRFTKIHAADDFVRRYMVAIGHHEFGKGLKPVDFGGWLAQAPDPDDLHFWVRYWFVAYSHVLQHSGSSTVRLVSYSRLVERPAAALDRLAAAVDVPSSTFAGMASRLHPPRTHEVDVSLLPGSLLEKTSALYGELDERAVV